MSGIRQLLSKSGHYFGMAGFSYVGFKKTTVTTAGWE